MILQDRIMKLLKGRSQHKPLIGDDLLAKTGADPDEVNDALDDLQGRGALNRVVITRGDRTFTALWPTGLVPRALSWKDERNNGKGLMGAQLAHNVQQAAEASRQPLVSPITHPLSPIPNRSKPLQQAAGQTLVSPITHPLSPITHPLSPIPETPMVRIARPAQIVETPIASNRPRNTGINAGRVQQGVLEALRGLDDAIDVDTIFARLPSDLETTIGSIGKTLETLAKRGEIEASIRFHNSRHRRFYCLPGGAQGEAIAPAKAAVADCPDHAANIARLRKIGADDHIADAGKKVEEQKIQREIATSAQKQPVNSALRYLYDDVGALEIEHGGKVLVRLPQSDVTRLALFLAQVA